MWGVCITFETSMLPMKFLRIIAYPVSQLYGIVVYLRNKFYDLGIFPVKEFKLPVIAIGNLVTGGTGKTPHTEYLIRLLQEKYSVATLSRGYRRTTPGFLIATGASTSLDIGDEPKQFKKKFPEITVAVDTKRVRGIKKLMESFSLLNVILLDDAFQHRSVSPGLSILLSDFNNLFYTDHLLPSGNLREFKSGFKRADIIVITKTPELLSPLERRRILKELNAQPYQHVYFSYIRYGDFIPLLQEKTQTVFTKDFYFERDYTILLMTGIANASSIEHYLTTKVKKVITVKFSDHHEYTMAELLRVKSMFEEIPGKNKIILTTEKDAMRFESPGITEIVNDLPVFYIPIEVEFHNKDKEDFNKQILDYVRGNPVKQISF